MGRISPDVSPGLVVMGFGLLGLLVAAMEKVGFDNGFIVDDYIQGSITLVDLQIVTIVLCLLIGVAVGVITSK
jgi:hypothetical protein